MKVQHHVPLAAYTSLHAGGAAEDLIELEAGDDLREIIKNLKRPVRVLGYGTNVLVSDKGLPGSVLINKSGSIDIDESGIVRADSGANWDELVVKAIDRGLWGLEFTSGIPGGVGAAVAGSIAAYGHRVSDRFVSAEVLDTQTGEVSAWGVDKFDFGYRRSRMQLPENSKFVILKVSFKLEHQPTGEMEYQSALKAAADIGIKPDTLSNRRRIIMEARRRAGSLLADVSQGPWTAGSFFKNPLVDESQVQAIVGHDESGVSREQLLRQNVIHGGDKTRVSAAHVLLAAGFKRGQAWGRVRLHPDHILKIENTGGATAQEIYDAVQNIIVTVRERLGITLEPEVRFLGEF
ncbi:MAG TPA: FAD-binding protein [Candidatus Saccharimonadales bacterium]|nr:FAD-binding protein [Candidatus Saccharimonadales bacterium]